MLANLRHYDGRLEGLPLLRVPQFDLAYHLPLWGEVISVTTCPDTPAPPFGLWKRGIEPFPRLSANRFHELSLVTRASYRPSFAPEPRAHRPRPSAAFVTWSAMRTAAPRSANGRSRCRKNDSTSVTLFSSKSSAANASAIPSTHTRLGLFFPSTQSHGRIHQALDCGDNGIGPLSRRFQRRKNISGEYPRCRVFGVNEENTPALLITRLRIPAIYSSFPNRLAVNFV